MSNYACLHRWQYMHAITKSEPKGYAPISTALLMCMQIEKLNATMLCHARLTPDRF